MKKDDVGKEGARYNREHGGGNQMPVSHQNSDVHDDRIITSEAEMYIISSMAGRSLGNGNRFWTSSSSDKPVDHTSDRIV